MLASDAGYGFVVQFGQLLAKNKAGKAVLTLPKKARVLSPAAIAAGGQDPLVVVATNEGRMLVFPLADLPELARGKGNKLIGLPSARAAAREECVVGLCVVAEGDTLQVTSAGTTAISSGRSSNIFEASVGVVAASCQRATRG